MKIPYKFEEIIKQDQALHSLVLDVVNDSSFGRILKDNKLFFFEEYTEHGIEHIEMVLKAAEFLIPDESFEYIQPKEVAILILAIVLHDIGMHAEFSTFKAMIDGKYDDVRVDMLDKKTWQELWQDYLSEVRHFSSKQKENVFGNPSEIVNEPDLSNKDKLNGTDKKLIGEFIRRHHARLAHEIALKGLIGNTTIPFGNESLSDQDRKFAGIVARSHGMNIRDTFEYLKEIAYDDWKNPADMNIVFLMVLLRIADYLQIDKARTDKTLLKLKTFNSPISLREHQAHLAISYLTFQKEDPELISVTADPKDARTYVKIQNLIKDIQHEFDLSWAILGETYGFLPGNKPKMKFRRITSNLEHSAFLKKINFVPQKISFQVNNELSKLLVAPLYGDNPTYGVRELVQNATDACKERTKIEQDKGNKNYNSLVTVSIDKTDNGYLFRIKDNGKGMTLEEILNYFLSVGSSFRKTIEWKKEFTSEDGKSLVSRNGKFGIGVLAAFLLGDEVTVKTKSYKNNSRAYEFETGINSEYIDIKQLSNFDIGTEIEILMSNERFEQLPKGGFDYYHKAKMSWKDWYINDVPRIKYLLDNKQVYRVNLWHKPSAVRRIHPQNYGVIHWSYPDSQNLFISNIYRKMFVACNDIIITANSKRCEFLYSKKHRYQYYDHQDNFIISYKPDLFINDVQGILPLRLDRNDLDTEVLPFENELLLDISKDFVSRLLMFPVSLKEIKNYQDYYNSDAYFLYSANGFSLYSDYFVNRIKDFNFIRIITSSKGNIENHSSIFKLSEKSIIYPKFDTTINLTQQNQNIATAYGGRFSLPKKKYDNLFDNQKSRVSKWIKSNHQIDWETDEYVVYNIINYARKNSFLEDEKQFVSLMEEMGNEIQSIQELPLEYFQQNSYKGGEILNQLFEKYIGDNVIIPYDIEERKKLYPRAFGELKGYMKDYEKK